MCHPDGRTHFTLLEPVVVSALSFLCRYHSDQSPAFSCTVPAPWFGCLASSTGSIYSPGGLVCSQWFRIAAKMLRVNIIHALSGFKLQKKLSSTRRCLQPLLYGLKIV